MLEAVILDTAERLLASSGERSALSNISNLISAQSQMTCLARDSKVAFPFSSLASFGNGGNNMPATWRSDTDNVLLLAEQSGSFNVVAVNLDTGAMTQDSTARQFNYITEDASGVIWANAIDAANYGLWKRTGAGAWTKVLADTGGGAVRRWVDNKIYYRSNASNWYECTAGTAVVSTNPNTLFATWTSYTGDGSSTNDNVCSYGMTYSPGYLTGLGILPATAGYYATATNEGRYWPTSAAGGQTTGTKIAPIGNVNWETLAECTQTNLPNLTTDIQVSTKHQFIRLDNTYMLHVIPVAINATATTRLMNVGPRKLVLTLLNKTTGVNKYLGSLHLTAHSTISISTTVAALVYGNVVGAKLSSGVLDLWIAQGTYTTGAAFDVYGLFKKSLTLNLDF